PAMPGGAGDSGDPRGGPSEGADRQRQAAARSVVTARQPGRRTRLEADGALRKEIERKLDLFVRRDRDLRSPGCDRRYRSRRYLRGQNRLSGTARRKWIDA